MRLDTTPIGWADNTTDIFYVAHLVLNWIFMLLYCIFVCYFFSCLKASHGCIKRVEKTSLSTETHPRFNHWTFLVHGVLSTSPCCLGSFSSFIFFAFCALCSSSSSSTYRIAFNILTKYFINYFITYICIPPLSRFASLERTVVYSTLPPLGNYGTASLARVKMRT